MWYRQLTGNIGEAIYVFIYCASKINIRCTQVDMKRPQTKLKENYQDTVQCIKWFNELSSLTERVDIYPLLEERDESTDFLKLNGERLNVLFALELNYNLSLIVHLCMDWIKKIPKASHEYVCKIEELNLVFKFSSDT